MKKLVVYFLITLSFFACNKSAYSQLINLNGNSCISTTSYNNLTNAAFDACFPLANFKSIGSPSIDLVGPASIFLIYSKNCMVFDGPQGTQIVSINTGANLLPNTSYTLKVNGENFPYPGYAGQARISIGTSHTSIAGEVVLGSINFTGNTVDNWQDYLFSFISPAVGNYQYVYVYNSTLDGPNVFAISSLEFTLTPCTTPTALTCQSATSLAAGSAVTSTVTGGSGGTVTWAISPTTGVSTTSGSGSSTGAITFANTGIYTVTFTSTNNSSPSGCTPTATTTCARTISVNCAAINSIPVLESN